MISKSNLNNKIFPAFYRLQDPMSNRYLRLTTCEPEDQKTVSFLIMLFRGMETPNNPILLEGYMGSKISDFMHSGLLFIRVISNRVLFILKDNYVTGWKTYPVEVHDRGGNLLPGYHGFSVIGKECRRDRSRSQIITKQAVPGGEPFEVYKGLYFFEEDWDGSDIFLVQNNMIVVTEKVRNLFKKNKVTNVKFIPLEEIELDVYLDKFEKDI